MSYMESKMQDQIEGSIALQNAICNDACEIYKETGIMPLDMKAQRDELLEALQKLRCELILSDVDMSYIESHFRVVLNNADLAISRAAGNRLSELEALSRIAKALGESE